MNEPAIALRNVDVGYRSRPLFLGLNLEIAKGSFQGVLGANGTGKSTLLKTMASVLPPLRGRVEFSPGSDVIGYVPQKEQLEANYLFSAYDVTLMGGCRVVGPGRRFGSEVRAKAMAMLELTGAAAFAKQLYSQLSGGQKQRTLIARALMTEPQLLILDEPTAGVDPAASESIFQLLIKLQKERGLTVILVTHDLPLVRRHLKEAIWVHDGRIHQGEVKTMLDPRHVGEMLGINLE